VSCHTFYKSCALDLKIIGFSGNGVVFTATWLLPVALLPMSWDAGDINGPRLASQQEKDAPPSDDINTTEDKEDGKEKQKQAKKKSIFSWR
jgi:hypothetical protein